MSFDQVRLYGNSTNSSSGATLLYTVDLKVDAPFTSIINTGTLYSFYLCVLYNSYTTTASDVYSDGIAGLTGWSENTVGALIQSALEATKSERGGRLTDSWFFREFNDCARFVTGKLKRF